MFFKIGDFITPVLIGGITAAAVAATVLPGGSMIASMVIGMLWGMAAQVIVFLLLMPLFGAFEIMVPAMLAGMAGGMLTGMLAASGITGYGGLIGVGILVGVAVFGWVWWRNKALQGETL
jgi:hypothetical protein